MQSQKNFSTTKPILKTKPHQLILSIHPQPPTEHRLPPNLEQGKMSRKTRNLRDKLPLRECVDYDKLTPSEQAKWDEGMFGALSLKNDRGREYYVIRWTDPRNGVRRTNTVGKTYAEAKMNWRKLVLGD